MSSVYRPHHLSLAHKVTTFFQANRDEELDADAIVGKFGCARTGVHTNLLPALAAGWLRRIEDPSTQEVLYAAGPELPEAAAAVLTKAMQSVAGGRNARRPILAVDLATVRIDKGVPLPGPKGRRVLDYAVLLDRLVEVGDSAELPLQARSGLHKAVKVRKESGQVFTLRVDGDTVRVWRQA